MKLAAIFFNEHGIHILPVKPKSKSLVEGYGPHRRHLETAEQIEDWFKKHPDSNFAVCTGTGGLVVVDFDDPQTYEAWCEKYPAQALTFTVRTGRGFHLYFTCVDMRSWQGPGFEIKGENRTIVAPPSIHPSGAVYTPRSWRDSCNDKKPFMKLPSLAPFFPTQPSPALDQTAPVQSEPVDQTVKFLERLKAAWPVYELASQLTQLTPSGGSNHWFKGRCPFIANHDHGDRNSSFWIDATRGTFGCFSCHEHGDSINLYAYIHRISVREAINRMVRERLSE